MNQKAMKNSNETIRREVTFPAGLQIREREGAESRTIEGYAIIFGEPSAPFWSDDQGECREVIAREAVSRELLDASDIKMTMFHDRQLILARSLNGEGTLSYEVDDKGVRFSFEAPNTVDGDKALELVKRGDISGCSFMFSTRYYDESCVSHDVEIRDGRVYETYTVRVITGIYDFTLAADPAYPDTTVDVRDLADALRQRREESQPQPEPEKEPEEEINNYKEQVAEMRARARVSIQ